jgi:hypothetical protein
MILIFYDVDRLDRGDGAASLHSPANCVPFLRLDAFLFVLLKYKSPAEDKAGCSP